MSIIEDFLLQKVEVKYNGKKYYGNNVSMSLNDETEKNYSVDTIPAKIQNVVDIEETNDIIFLKLGSLNFNIVDDKPCFSFEYNKKIGFDKKNLKGIGEKLTIDDITDNTCFFYNTMTSYILSIYIYKIVQLNNNILNFFDKCGEKIIVLAGELSNFL